MSNVRKQKQKKKKKQRKSKTVSNNAPRTSGRKQPKQPKAFNSVRMGQRIGRLFGPQAGRVGAEAGRLFRQVTGFGDYKVSSNTLLTAMDRLPSFKNTNSGTRITHREYLFDVITSDVKGGFKNTSIPIQPALSTSFPWLAASAENYQEYQLNGVVYEFKSNSYDALSSTNTASGTVVMATNYNVLEPEYPNKFQMEQSQFCSSCKPSVDLMHPIECNKVETPSHVLYTRSGPITTGDARLYDWGKFQIATVGMQGASTNIGELWVTYDITLLKPRLSGTTDVHDHYILPVPGFVPGGTVYFGSVTTPPTLSADSDMGTKLVASDGNGYDIIVWPPTYSGKVCLVYRCEVKTTASASVATPYSIAYSGGANPINAFGGASPSNEQYAPLLYNAEGGVTYVLFLDINTGGQIQFLGGTTSNPPMSGDLFLISLPLNFNMSALLSTTRRRPVVTPDVESDSEVYDICGPRASHTSGVMRSKNEMVSEKEKKRPPMSKL
jgi:hypothetical protein